MKTKLFGIVIDVTRPTKAKAAVISPEPTVYIMMRSMIELVLLKGVSDLRRWRRTTMDKARTVSTLATRDAATKRLREALALCSDCVNTARDRKSK